MGLDGNLKFGMLNVPVIPVGNAGHVWRSEARQAWWYLKEEPRRPFTPSPCFSPHEIYSHSHQHTPFSLPLDLIEPGIYSCIWVAVAGLFSFLDPRYSTVHALYSGSGNDTIVGLTLGLVASFTGNSRLKFLIACCAWKQRGKVWKIWSCAWCQVDRG